MKFKDFELTLSKRDKFNIAFFERKLYKRHFNQLKRAISEGKMIDNIITVIPENNRYKIIDGQHRFLALIDLLKEDIKKSFTLHLRILDDLEYLKNGIETYIRLDSGKPLTAIDVVKAYHTEDNQFFNILSQFCIDYKDTKNLSFYDVLVAYKYAITGVTELRRDDIQKTLLKINKEDCFKLAYLLSNIYTVMGRNTSHHIFKISCFRNLTRILFFNPLFLKKQSTFQAFIKDCANDNFIRNNYQTRSNDGFKAIFNYMQGIAQKHINIDNK